MADLSPRLQLPLLAVGQAQKEATHNEALSRLEMCVQPVVEDELSVPPLTPQDGQCWLVGTGAQGSWTGQEGSIAQWTEGGWRYLLPFDGFSFWMRASGLQMARESGTWTAALRGSSVRIDGKQVVGPQQSGISLPSGGAFVDADARASIGAIIATLAAHGLISN